MNIEEFYGKMDWELLRKQKQFLMNIATVNKTDQDSIDGILQLMDDVQDMAVDDYGFPENDVFGKHFGEEFFRPDTAHEAYIKIATDSDAYLPSSYLYRNKEDAEADWPGVPIITYAYTEFEDATIIEHRLCKNKGI